MKNKYIVKINKKYFFKIIEYSIYCLKIKNKNDYYYLTLDEDNYNKIIKFKDIFEIKIVGYKGLIYYKNIFKQYYIFLLFSIISCFYIIFLSNIIFDIEIKSNNNILKTFVLKELSRRKISKLNFVVSFDEKERIKKDILDKNKDKLEWMEITRIGSKYVVNIEERIKKELNDNNNPRNIIASKNAIIMSIEATRGSIVKKLNDYVKKGEVIVSGEITHKEKIVDLVKADAKIYGETWYTVHISYPVAYYEKTYTGNKSKRLKFKLFNKDIIIGKKYKEEEIDENIIFQNNYIPIKLSLDTTKEVIITDDIYTIGEAYEKCLELAKVELLKQINDDSKILSQKKLKIIINNSTIDVDIFFKVYENITGYIEIKR